MSVDINTRGFYANQGVSRFDEEIDICVCTIEKVSTTTSDSLTLINKANSLTNKLLEDGRLDEIGIVVIDELHMMSDPDRGYILELLVTKLLYKNGEKLQVCLENQKLTLFNR
jgi:DNA polymerase theta